MPGPGCQAVELLLAIIDLTPKVPMCRRPTGLKGIKALHCLLVPYLAFL